MITDFTNFPIGKGDRVAFADYFEGCLKSGTVTGFDGNYVIVCHTSGDKYRLLCEDIIVTTVYVEKESWGL